MSANFKKVDFEVPLSEYRALLLLYKGKFSSVHIARNKHEADGSSFALKKFNNEDDANREISLLRTLKDEKNIVRLIDVMQEDQKVTTIIMELCEGDFFYILIVQNIRIEAAEIKNILQQFLKGLDALHCKSLMHRDIRSANLLLSFEGVVKICDFGSTTECIPNDERSQIFSNSVVFRWYKSPELLLGDKHYCKKIDIWAAGCVAYELWANKILFNGYDLKSQLMSITETCGFITKDTWNAVETLADYKEYSIWARKFPKSHLQEKIANATEDEAATDLILSLLQLNPYSRKTADVLLRHRYFCKSQPTPAVDLSEVFKLINEKIPHRLSRQVLEERKFRSCCRVIDYDDEEDDE